MSDRRLFDELRQLATEQRNPRSTHIDTASVAEILRVINTEDRLVAEAVGSELDAIERAVNVIVAAFKSGGRLFYVGAGTSGRMGVLDASECPPTFGTPPDLVQGIIAGGPDAVFRSIEGAEDFEEGGAQALVQAGVTSTDVVCGIAASRRTPFVIGAVKAANEMGCNTIFITCTPRAEFTLPVTVAICPVVGPEVVMGSTRMKSGTAQKLVLNMLTTASMVRLGKTYENLMVDLQMTNRKLVERSIRILMMITGADYQEADTVLKSAEGHVKTALVMQLAGVSIGDARRRLHNASGFVRLAIEDKTYTDQGGTSS
jgi:N-acetylmuramic acid 6-phosphate etherase